MSSSTNPLQPPDASSEEPFTTYFDSKIPIPDDETVRKPRRKTPRALATGVNHSLGCRFPFSCLELMTYPSGFLSCKAPSGKIC